MTTSNELIALLRINAHALHAETIFADWPAARELKRILENPRPGDFVIETSTVHFDRPWCIEKLRRPSVSGIGRLICVRTEFVPFDEPQEDEAGYNETFTYIEGFDGALQRWHNCGFHRVLNESMHRLRENDPADDQWVSEAMKRHNLVGADA